jgi:hypothetical protein
MEIVLLDRSKRSLCGVITDYNAVVRLEKAEEIGRETMNAQ